jgi:site-specific recombinase XerD
MYQNKLKLGEDSYFFPSSHDKGKHITRQRADQIIKRAGKKAGINEVGGHLIHCHVLRHSFAVWSAQTLKTPADLKLLQMLMGHANIETTSHYLQFAQKEVDKLLNDLPDFLQFGLSDEELKERLADPLDGELDPSHLSDKVISDL